MFKAGAPHEVIVNQLPHLVHGDEDVDIIIENPTKTEASRVYANHKVIDLHVDQGRVQLTNAGGEEQVKVTSPEGQLWFEGRLPEDTSSIEPAEARHLIELLREKLGAMDAEWVPNQTPPAISVRETPQL